MPANDVMTLVIALPKDLEARQELLNGLESSINSHGGLISSRSPEDEMTICERLEEHLPDWRVTEIRKQVAGLHQQHETGNN